MQSLQQPMDNQYINTLLSQTQNMVDCDETCKKNNALYSAYEKFIKAEQIMQDAPTDYLIAKKEYITKKDGPIALEQQNEEETKKKIKPIAQKFNGLLEKYKNKIQQNYTQTLQYNNLLLFYNELKDKNIYIARQIAETNANTITNDRKSHYIEDYWQNAHYYSKTLQWLFWGVFIILAVSYFYNEPDKRPYSLAVWIIVLCVAFFSSTIFFLIGKLFEFIKKYGENSVHYWFGGTV